MELAYSDEDQPYRVGKRSNLYHHFLILRFGCSLDFVTIPGILSHFVRKATGYTSVFVYAVQHL